MRSLITCGDDDGPFLVEHVGTCGRRRRRKPRRQSSLRRTRKDQTTPGMSVHLHFAAVPRYVPCSSCTS